MRVRFNQDYGVYTKGKVYEIPHEFAVELIEKKKVGVRAALTAEPPAEAVKVMKPSQVKRKGGVE